MTHGVEFLQLSCLDGDKNGSPAPVIVKRLVKMILKRTKNFEGAYTQLTNYFEKDNDEERFVFFKELEYQKNKVRTRESDDNLRTRATTTRVVLFDNVDALVFTKVGLRLFKHLLKYSYKSESRFILLGTTNISGLTTWVNDEEFVMLMGGNELIFSSYDRD